MFSGLRSRHRWPRAAFFRGVSGGDYVERTGRSKYSRVLQIAELWGALSMTTNTRYERARSNADRESPSATPGGTWYELSGPE